MFVSCVDNTTRAFTIPFVARYETLALAELHATIAALRADNAALRSENDRLMRTAANGVVASLANKQRVF